MTTNKKGAPTAPQSTTVNPNKKQSNTTDFLTLLTTLGPVLTKTFRADGGAKNYGAAKNFKSREIEVSNIKDLAAKLVVLEAKSKVAIIRGKISATPERGENPGTVLRTNVSFNDCPHHWLMIDIDKYKPGFADPLKNTADAVRDFLEDAGLHQFKDCSFHWQLSSSAGTPGKEEILKCHAWFWSETAYSSSQMYAWAQRVGILVDKAVYRRVQLHYTASPVFEEGAEDPVAVRSGFYQGASDTVPLTMDSALLESARITAGGKDTKLVDPSEKEGLIGDFHRAFGVETVLTEHLEGMFEPGSNARRWTWLDGGGTPEGVWVHDDGMHVHATHNTWPIEGICNLWDLVRVFKFGELDKADDDFDQMDLENTPIQGRPSHQAMIEWARTLPELANLDGIKRQEALEHYREKIRTEGDERVLRDEVCKDIGEDKRLDKGTRNMLVPELNKRLGELNNGVKPGLPAVRNMVLPLAPQHDNDGWLSRWYYVTELDKFFRYDTDEWLTAQSFNARYNRKGPLDSEGKKLSASYFALEVKCIPVVTRGLYHPRQERYFEYQGTNCVNTYRPSLLPKAVDALDAAGKAAVDCVLKHIDLFCGGRRYVSDHFLNWIAHNVQYPGVKIRHSPILCGIEGDGKSVIGELIGAVLGGVPNVKPVSPETINGSDFTGWSEGSCVCILEEIKMHGHNRFDLLNKIKPKITNDIIDVHRKGLDPYAVPNVTNYIAFTNFKDALPLSSYDRRWFVVFSTWRDVAEFEKAIGCAPAQYFHRLHQAIRKHLASLRRWFLDRDLSKFDPHATPPVTEEKDTMVALGTSDEASLARDLIAEGGSGFNEHVVATSMLTSAIEAAGGPKPSTTFVSRLVADLGFHPFGGNKTKPFKWRGKTHRVWTREKTDDPELVRHLLDATLANEADGDFQD